MPPKRKEIPFATRLKLARTDIAAACGHPKKFTQAEMAEVLGISPNYCARLERGEEPPTLTMKRCLVYALNLATFTRINPLHLKVAEKERPCE